MKAPLPPKETERLAALRQHEILDTVPEQAFDDLTMVAAQICQVPMAQVSFVDDQRQWFKSRVGVNMTGSPRDTAFCAHTILHTDGVLEVHDAAMDPRFADSPLVTAGDRIRFYAGAPLVTADGHALGALCVMDRVPRTLTPEQLAALQALSRRVVAQLELRRQARDLAEGKRETHRLLTMAEKSRRALLSVLEDEKRAGQSLRESEERFRQIAENITEVFWLRDVEKNQVLYISPGYEKIWGRSRADLYAASSSWVEAIYPEDRVRVQEATTLKSSQEEYSVTYRIVRPDGGIRWISARAYPVRDAQGQAIRVVGVAADITERKQLEEQFLRTQRMEAIGTLAAGVAHDLNNILAPMLMVAGLLKSKHTSSSDQQLLSMVESGAQRGAGIIRQLLMFSRGMSGERISLQLRHLVKEFTALMRETFPRGIVIEEDMGADLWPILGDGTQLHQVMMNLCVNARDAMPRGGKLTIATKNIELDATEARLHSAEGKPGRYVVLSVKDEGEGIPPEIIGRIFDPFFTTKEIGKGTGLGLSTVVGIVKGHEGFISVYSEPGKGTQFKVYLPVAEKAAQGFRSDSASPLARGRGELILVVDDEAPIREATRFTLEQHNYKVRVAHDGREALGVFLQDQDGIRLVLTDVMMPVMDGLALTRALRAINSAIPVIATTGLDQEGRKADLAELGVQDVLIKPCSPAELLTAVHHRLGRS